MLCIVLQCFFGRDFLSPHTTIVPGIENFASTSMSCYSGDLAQLLPCLARPLKSVIQKISVRE